MRCLVNVYGIDRMVSEGRAYWPSTLNPAVPLIAAPKGQPGQSLAHGGVEREAISWHHEGRKEFLWFWSQTSSDLSQIFFFF